ncbi:MAG: TolC family protein [Deltaproteobacteria bacterium]|nr:TolC family protein [Deltaproteobacteria bacterium]
MNALREDVEGAQGRLEKAKFPLSANPVIESYLAGKDKPREDGGGTYTNYGFKLSQEFEIAGQRGLRIDIAEKDLARLALEIKNRERVLKAEVSDAFARALAAKKKEGLARQVVAVQEEMLHFTRLKFQAGEVSGLEVNLAEVELGKSQKDFSAAGREYLEASIRLQGLMGSRVDAALPLEGELYANSVPFPEKEIIWNKSLAERPDLKASTYEADLALNTLELAKKGAIPNIILGGFYNRDEMRNELGVSASISIPLFDQKQAEKKEARARVSQARIKKAGLERTAQREFEEAYSAFNSTQKEFSLFKKEILAKALENLELLNLAYREGKIGYYNLRLAQKETIETQFAYIDTQLRARLAANALEKIIGGDLK